VPVKVRGKREKHVVAYVRRYLNRGLVVAAGRLHASLGLDADTPPLGAPVWDDTQLDLSMLPADIELNEVLSGTRCVAVEGRLDLARAFQYFPGAMFYFEH
jgi:maltooligosyltrehalose synthase